MPASFGFLSSYPPTQCGLATFTAALRAEVEIAGHETGVVRVLERADPLSGRSVLPYGMADANVGVAVVPVQQVLGRMT